MNISIFYDTDAASLLLDSRGRWHNGIEDAPATQAIFLLDSCLRRNDRLFTIIPLTLTLSRKGRGKPYRGLQQPPSPLMGEGWGEGQKSP